jgi:ribosomal small subunit protein bTHX
MGRGDRKSRRGKIWRGTYGNTRLRKSSFIAKQKATAEAKATAETAEKA